jgi:hypothetical protein
MADNKRQQRAAEQQLQQRAAEQQLQTEKREEPPSEDQTAEGVTPDMLEWMSRELLGIDESGRTISDADWERIRRALDVNPDWPRRKRLDQKRGRSEEDTKKFSEGGANFSQDSRGTGAALTGRNFRGVF